MRHILGVTCLTILLTPPAVAADLGKVERKILREPSYRSNPKYCLLVFGPKATTRVWLVLDGDTLYVDRNGNGDLTEEDEKVASERVTGREGSFYFKAGELRDGQLTHKNLYVSVSKLEDPEGSDPEIGNYLKEHPRACRYSIGVDVEMVGWRGAGLGGRVSQWAHHRDINGFLQFADRPQDAPVIHFGGPLRITLFGKHTLTIGRETEVYLGVGTPGLGPGTTAYIAYEEVIPESAFPMAKIAYPAAVSGEPPVIELYELKHRC